MTFCNVHSVLFVLEFVQCNFVHDVRVFRETFMTYLRLTYYFFLFYLILWFPNLIFLTRSSSLFWLHCQVLLSANLSFANFFFYHSTVEGANHVSLLLSSFFLTYRIPVEQHIHFLLQIAWILIYQKDVHIHTHI